MSKHIITVDPSLLLRKIIIILLSERCNILFKLCSKLIAQYLLISRNKNKYVINVRIINYFIDGPRFINDLFLKH